MSNEIIVVGAGIMGMLSARELCLAGAKVTLLDRQEVARESSWAGGGIVSPLYPWRYADAITRLASWSQERYQGLCLELEANVGISPQWQQNGLLMLDTGEAEQALGWAERFARRMRLIDASEIAELEPGLERVPAQALWMDDVAQVRNPRIAKALSAEMLRLGVEVHEHRPVQSIISKDGKVRGVATAQGMLEADQVVVCAGAWSAALLQDWVDTPAVRPVRGQMILFKAEPGEVQRITLFDGHYCIPRLDGRVLMGSTLEDVGFDKATTEVARDELLQLSTDRFPRLKRYAVEHHWAGLRPGSPEGIPYIGEHPQIQGLFVNAGQYRNGVVLGPASARLLADLMVGRAPIVDPSPYALRARRSSAA